MPEGLDLRQSPHEAEAPDHPDDPRRRRPRARQLGLRPRLRRPQAATQEKHGPDGVAIFGGGGLTNEKAYLLGKFARVALGTSQIDYNGRFCMSSAAAAGTKAFGVDRGMPFPVTDLKNADVVLLAGANPAETMPPFIQHLRGADLIVVDPRRTPTAELASLHLRPRPARISRWHWASCTPSSKAATSIGPMWTPDDGLRGGRRIAASWWPERAERVTGVPAADSASPPRSSPTPATPTS